jgi:hypothetical protein
LVISFEFFKRNSFLLNLFAKYFACCTAAWAVAGRVWLIGVAQSPSANILLTIVLSSTKTCKWSFVYILPERFSLKNGKADVNSVGERPIYTNSISLPS